MLVEEERVGVDERGLAGALDDLGDVEDRRLRPVGRDLEQRLRELRRPHSDPGAAARVEDEVVLDPEAVLHAVVDAGGRPRPPARAAWWSSSWRRRGGRRSSRSASSWWSSWCCCWWWWSAARWSWSWSFRATGQRLRSCGSTTRSGTGALSMPSSLTVSMSSSADVSPRSSSRSLGDPLLEVEGQPELQLRSRAVPSSKCPVISSITTSHGRIWRTAGATVMLSSVAAPARARQVSTRIAAAATAGVRWVRRVHRRAATQAMCPVRNAEIPNEIAARSCIDRSGMMPPATFRCRRPLSPRRDDGATRPSGRT